MHEPIPADALKKFQTDQHHARKHGIPFEFSFYQWWEICSFSSVASSGFDQFAFKLGESAKNG